MYLGLAIGPFICGETLLAAAASMSCGSSPPRRPAVAAGCCAARPRDRAGVLAAAARGERPPARLFHPAGVLPGFLILTGAWGMAGFLTFVPLHANRVGLDGAGIPLAMYPSSSSCCGSCSCGCHDQVGAARLSWGALVVGAVGLALVGTLPVRRPVHRDRRFRPGIAFSSGPDRAGGRRWTSRRGGSVVGTSSAFCDLSFGLAPALLGVVVDASGYPRVFIVLGRRVGGRAGVLFLRRRSLVVPVPSPV